MSRSLAGLLLILAIVGSTSRGAAQTGRPPWNHDAAFARLQRERGPVRARFDDRTGEPRFLEGNLGAAQAATASRAALEGAARAFFARYRDLFGIGDAARELQVRGLFQDARGYGSVRFDQYLGGVPILGSDIRAEFDRAGILHTIHGRLIPQLRPPSLQPWISANRAAAIARAELAAARQPERAPELFVMRGDTADYLVWRVMLQTGEPARWQIMVDALSGNVVERQDILETARLRQTYSANFSSVLPGTLMRSEGDPPIADVDVNAAHDNAGTVYNYYYTSFGRDSIDGNGMPIMSSVHYKQGYNGAFWNGSQIAYGDGDGQQFAPLDRALDISAHELTHGVTQYTAALVYADQPGALNEAYSDIFGALIDSANWQIGEAVYTPGVAGDALRSLSDPTRYGQPSVWGEYLATALDNGGVHFNSGIWSYAAYLAAAQIGRPKLGQIYYRTLATKLTSSSSFEDARDLTLQSCGELVGVSGITQADCNILQAAMARAGIGAPPPPLPAAHRVYLPLILNQAMPCGADRIRNGGFEDDQEGWPNTGDIVGAWSKPGGSRSANLSGTAQLLQLVSLPSNITRLDLAFQFWAQPNAAVTISLEDPQTRATLSTTTFTPTAYGAWQQALISFPGLTNTAAVRLVFRHGSSAATIYLDDVQLNPVCGTP